jgi:hypothetical protein
LLLLELEAQLLQTYYELRKVITNRDERTQKRYHRVVAGAKYQQPFPGRKLVLPPLMSFALTEARSANTGEAQEEIHLLD